MREQNLFVVVTINFFIGVISSFEILIKFEKSVWPEICRRKAVIKNVIEEKYYINICPRVNNMAH